MIIQAFKHLEQLDDVFAEWENLYKSDKQATIFMSWHWMRGWLKVCPHVWQVLVCRSEPDGPAEGILPVSLRPEKTGPLGLESLHLAATPMADYTGLLVNESKHQQVLEAYAKYLADDMEWDVFHLKNVIDVRLEKVVAIMASRDMRVDVVATTPCPYLDLPDTWEEYRSNTLGRATRKNLGMLQRRLELQGELRLTEATEDTFDKHFEILLSMWQGKWGQRRPDVVGHFREIYKPCMTAGRLRISVLWQGDAPLAADSALADRDHNVLSLQLGGFNPEYSKFSPGKLLEGMTIKWAIENGFTMYDFLRGDEAYKYLFGAKNRHCTNTTVKRRNIKTRLASVYDTVKKAAC